MTETRGVRSRRFPLAFLAALLVLTLATPTARAACEGDAGGVGGTGQAPKEKPPGAPGKGKDRGGIGGTGHAERDRGGIGGTGLRDDEAGGIGGTGIVGVITGFGSVCVNGLEIDYDATTPVDANGAPADASSLAVGQVVVIEARERGGSLHAARIAVRDAAVGPIERFDRARNEIEVLGQRVQIDAATRIEASGDAPMLRPGDFVAVSGLRRGDGGVAATRIESRPPAERVSVTGPIAERPRGGAAVGDLAIELPQGGLPASLRDRVALVVGRMDPASGALRVERMEPAVRFDATPERLSLEGLVQQPNAKAFRTEHGEVDASALGASAAPPAGTRVIVNGALDGSGTLRALRIEVVTPERPSSPDPGRSKTDPAVRRPLDEHRSSDAFGKPERPEKAEKPEPPEKPEGIERPETPEAIEKPETPERIERPETPETPEIERPETPEIPDVQRPETPELPEIERPEIERPEVERPETPERPEIERPETPERPEFERPEAPEIPEIEPPEAPERPEIEHP